MLRLSEEQGGRAIKPLEHPDPALAFLSPEIIDVTDIAQRPDVELFGPILQVIKVHDFDEAIARPTRPASALPRRSSAALRKSTAISGPTLKRGS